MSSNLDIVNINFRRLARLSKPQVYWLKFMYNK